jgi:hopanoid-associated sugar epimerase
VHAEREAVPSRGTTFVTGGSGHVGANLVRALLERGEAVRCLVRPGSNNAALDGLDVERVEGDLRDRESIMRAVAGCRRVYHVAAFVSLRPGAQQEIFDVNVVGTRHLMEAVERAGVERTVFCSSLGAVGRNPGGVSDETFTVNPFQAELDYEVSKGLAEIEVLRAVVRGVDAVIVNPSGVVGPHDYKPSSVGKTILDFSHRKMPAYVPGAFEFVAVRDVVAGHLLAMEKGRRGERYILSSGHHTLDEILDHLHVLTGQPKPRLKLSPEMMLPIAHVAGAVMKAFFPDVPPRFTPGTIKLLQSGKRATTEKAQRELGFQPTSIMDAFTEAVEWFRARGQIPARA